MQCPANALRALAQPLASWEGTITVTTFACTRNPITQLDDESNLVRRYNKQRKPEMSESLKVLKTHVLAA
ncbi:hypothetical protein Mth01_49050 [Sphaerimonospora thailandensis]|uniref:Uncharacterized protein n=1 Tax=Sphaerimonospora thailandensis TaxID=795644 RepID=A0A8J3RBI1_9ACTN|nr:hypothetical protein Mth01_49050 [Sphaerimonospora thailandensis]